MQAFIWGCKVCLAGMYYHKYLPVWAPTQSFRVPSTYHHTMYLVCMYSRNICYQRSVSYNKYISSAQPVVEMRICTISHHTSTHVYKLRTSCRCSQCRLHGQTAHLHGVEHTRVHGGQVCPVLPLCLIWAISWWSNESRQTLLTCRRPEVNDKADQDNGKCREVEPEGLVMLARIRQLNYKKQWVREERTKRNNPKSKP